MTNELSKERALEALYTVRAYYASLTAGYPKGKDCRGIGDVMCSEIANSCLMAIEALEQEPCEDCISREAVRRILANQRDELVKLHTVNPKDNPKADAMAYGVNWSLNTLMELPSVTPKASEQQPSREWKEIYAESEGSNSWIEFKCPHCGYSFGMESGEYDWHYGDEIPWKYCPICGGSAEHKPYKAESEDKE